MGICGAKMKIAAEPEQRGKTPNKENRNKQRQKRNEMDDDHDSTAKQQTKQYKNQQQNKNGISQKDKNKTKEREIRSRNKSESIDEENRPQHYQQELEQIDGLDVFQVQVQRQNPKNDGYVGGSLSNQDIDRIGGDTSSRIEETKRVLTFKKGHVIDRGSYGEVYQCLDIYTGQLYAVKTIRKNKDKCVLEKEVAALAKEISEYKKLSHKNIVKYIDTELDEDEKGINIIFEFVSGGSIRQMLDKFGKFNEKVISIYTNQVLQGLNYLHQNNVIHRDIKGGNILIDTDGTIKLTDFGTLKLHKKDAFMLQNASMSYIPHGLQDSRIIQSQKPFWTAPEVLKNENYNETNSDIWSVGCLVIEMITAVPPYYDLHDKSSEEIARHIKEGKLPKFPENLSDQCIEFLENTLKVDPQQRATVEELMKLKFIAEPDLIENGSEQYSPNQVRSGIFQSQNSLGYVNQEYPMKSVFRPNQNGFYSDDPPQYMKDAGFFDNNTKNKGNGQGFQQGNIDENVIDLRGLSSVHQDNKNNKKTRENTPQAMYYSQQRSNKMGDDQSTKFMDQFHMKEHQTFENQIKRLFKETNQNYNEARDEYQQQLMSQFKEFEDKSLQVIPNQYECNIKKEEQKNVEDQILELIKKKKQDRKQNKIESNTPQQYKNQSISTFDTSIQNTNPPQIRFQVVFNNPKDNFVLLNPDDTIKHNEQLLKKQYNDIVQPEIDQSPATAKSQNQQIPQPSIFNNQRKQSDSNQQEIEQTINGSNKNDQQNNDFNESEKRKSPQTQPIQTGNQSKKTIQKNESENKLMLLQSDPISMTSLGVFDKVQGGFDDLRLYNFKVDSKHSKKSSKHQRSRTDFNGNRNGDEEPSFFKEVKRDINGKEGNQNRGQNNNQKRLIINEEDNQNHNVINNQNQNEQINNNDSYLQNVSYASPVKQNKQQSNTLVVEEYF